MTAQSRWRTILQIAWPLIIANSFWNVQLTVDRIYLGLFSTEALGAAMAVMGVFWVPMALLQQTASYVTTFVAQYFGAKEEKKIGSALWQALHVSFIGGLAFLGLNFLSSWFFGQVGHTPTLQALEVEYFNAVAFSALPTAIVAAISGFYTGLGQTKTVIGINLVGLLLNVILDYIMIFGKFGVPAMGVAGAGYATALATYGSALYGLLLIFQQKNEERYRMRSEWKLRWDLTKQFLRYGLPSGAQWALEGLSFTIFLIIIGRLPNGEAALSSSSIAVTVMMLSVMPSMGVAQAVMTLVGQLLGEKRAGEAEAVVWDGVKISMAYMATVAMTFVFIPEFYLSWFQNDSNPALWAQVSELAPKLLSIVAMFTVFDSIYFNVSFALKGAGDTTFVSLLALVVPWPFMVLPPVLLRGYENAVVLSWAFVVLYSMSMAGILTLRFRGGKWKQMSVIHPDP